MTLSVIRYRVKPRSLGVEQLHLCRLRLQKFVNTGNKVASDITTVLRLAAVWDPDRGRCTAHYKGKADVNWITDPKQRMTGFLAAVVCGLLLAQPLVARAGDDNDVPDHQWTMGGQNLNNSRNQYDATIKRNNVSKLSLKWVFTTGDDVSATPAVANGIVYFPDFAGNFYAVNADTGTLVWKRQVSNWTQVPGDYSRNDPVVYGNLVILGDQAGTTC